MSERSEQIVGTATGAFIPAGVGEGEAMRDRGEGIIISEVGA
ncbi:hypothetical protein [Nocardia nova]